MSQAIITVPQITRTDGRTSLGGVIGGLASLAAKVVTERRVRKAALQIEALDDRELADIGLGHGQAESAARYGRTSRLPAPVRRVPEAPLMPMSFTEWR